MGAARFTHNLAVTTANTIQRSTLGIQSQQCLVQISCAALQCVVAHGMSHQMHALTCAEKAMMTSSRPSLTLEGPNGELSSHSSMKSGILSRRISLTRRTRRSARTSLVDLLYGIFMIDPFALPFIRFSLGHHTRVEPRTHTTDDTVVVCCDSKRGGGYSPIHQV